MQNWQHLQTVRWPWKTQNNIHILPVFDVRKFPLHVLSILQNTDQKIETLLSRVNPEELNNLAKGSLMLRINTEWTTENTIASVDEKWAQKFYKQIFWLNINDIFTKKKIAVRILLLNTLLGKQGTWMQQYKDYLLLRKWDTIENSKVIQRYIQSEWTKLNIPEIYIQNLINGLRIENIEKSWKSDSAANDQLFNQKVTWKIRRV